MLKGALAAAVTPLREGGEALDEDAFAPYLGYLADGGLDGILALGTTGEGILLSADERKRAAELFVAVVGGLRDGGPDRAGRKVSNRPFEDGEPYLLEGLDVFVGAESLVVRGLERGAVGAVSGLAAVFPEAVARLVRERAGDVSHLRVSLEQYPFQAAAKFVLGRLGVPIREDVRRPLRTLMPDEQEALAEWLESS